MGGWLRVWVGLSLVSLSGCDVGPTGPSPIHRIEIESGDMQSAAPGETLSEPVVAQVYREDGSEAIYLFWAQLVDGGSVDLDGARASGEGATVPVPQMGSATAEWTLADVVGAQRLRFFAVRSPGDTIEAFATATAIQPE